MTIQRPKERRAHASCGAARNKTSVPTRPKAILARDDLEAAGRKFPPRPIFGRIAGAADTNAPYRANRSAFEDYAFIPLVPVDRSSRNQRRTVLGLSAPSLIPMETVRTVGPTTWFQAYLPGEPRRILRLMDRVQAAGFEAHVLTADPSVPRNRENKTRTGWSIPLRPQPDWLGMGCADRGGCSAHSSEHSLSMACPISCLKES